MMWFYNVKLVLVDCIIENGNLWVENGVIVEIEESIGVLFGYIVLSGFIDMYGDMIELELEFCLCVDFLMEVVVGYFDVCFVVVGVMMVYVGVFFLCMVIDGECCFFEYIFGII